MRGRGWVGLPAILVASFGLGVADAPARATPIKHVVVVYQENHSFDNVLGRLCLRTGRCSGSRTGYLPDDQEIPRVPTVKELIPPPDALPAYARGPNFRFVGARFRSTAIDHGLRPDHRVLDLGCGVGRFAVALSKYLNEGSWTCAIRVAIPWF
ncbi:MAG: alkaline phosphatase family protein [Solirubrobacterales bacterium]